MSDKPKTVAEAAYSELLFMPIPQTPLDFRRAIVMAVMVGRQLEADFAGSPWQSTPPTVPGDWEVACNESGFEPVRVRVIYQAGELWVECPHVGTNPLSHYHGNLIDIRWRPIK